MAMHFMLCFPAGGPTSAETCTFGCWMLPGLHARDKSKPSEPPNVLDACITIAKQGSTQPPSKRACTGSFHDPVM